MQIAHLDTVVAEEFSQLLGHALGQRRHQHAFVFLDAQGDFGHQVIDLRAGGTHADGGIDQTGRAHHLLHDLSGVLFLIVGRRRGHEHRLPHLALEFIEAQRPVVERGRQPESVIHEIGLARAVAVVHAVELPHQHVRLVEEHQRILRQIVDQGRRRLARFCATQMTRIVFDAFGKTDFLHHLKVEAGALFQPLFLDQLVLLAEPFEPLAQFVLDGVDRAQHGGARRHVMRAGIDREARNLLPHAPGQWIE